MNKFGFVQAIKVAVAADWLVTPADLEGKSRQKRYVQPRIICYWLAREYGNATYPVIARLFGARNHSTIIQGVRAAQRYFRKCPSLKERAISIKDSVIKDLDCC